MQSSSAIVSSSKSLSPSLLLPKPQRFTAPSRNQSINSMFSCRFPKFPTPVSYLQIAQRTLSLVRCAATTVFAERTKVQTEFVEIGYIYSVHGLQGEVRVKPSTDFPELRFSEPGRRWLRQQIAGREMIQEIELVEGRGHPGQKSWIIRFDEIDSVDQALKLVGSTILVREEDRPELEEGEFYTRDLVGMTVIIKETGEPVGTVVNVFNSGANDLLHVELRSSLGISNPNGKLEKKSGDAGPLVWIPFVEAIVPDIDLVKREMLITPPKGLLELNVRSDERSKKERRQLEWKERKKFQKRLIAAKKKLSELDQQHVFEGFRHGEKSQASLLANEIVTVNSKLLEQALHCIQMPTESMQDKHAFRIPEKCFSMGTRTQSDGYTKLQEKGLYLTSHGKVAVILVLEESDEHGKSSDHDTMEENEKINAQLVEELSNDNQQFVKNDARPSVPLILVSPGHLIGSLQQLFVNHDYFSFDPEKVFFLGEEKLPVVSISLDDCKKHKILMKSPWEILQKSVGSGGVISLLSSNNFLDNLSELGIEYIEVRNINARYRDRQALLGFVDSNKANIGLHALKDMNDSDANLDMIFSMNFMKKLTKRINKLHFEAIPKQNRHVQKIDKDWVEVIPSLPNSFEFHSSIYSCLSSCFPSEICVLYETM
ncbi:hypothetical protein M9H77_11129 [Catharanthus roseus]|uniref:Uncharacterized protein n=1 Tax=Catharanthus roseus TaxID=4058 RepID=A0ACC0BDR3_CATRO|nr:hypothetical protein M9H77_11129 [Catharanthus roseus]